MSKFFEALERAERGEVLGTEAPSSRPATGTSPSPPPAAPSRGVEPAAPPHLGRPVVEPPAPVTKPRVDRPNRAEDHLVSLFDSESWEAEQYRVLRHAVETLRKGVNLQIVAVTSAAFGAGHFVQGVDASIATGLLGAFWGLTYLRRRSCVAPMVSHAGFDLVQVVQYLGLR